MAKSSSVELEQRAEFCWRALRRKERGERFQEICVAYGISRTTGYEWVWEFQRAGREGLRAKSRARHSPCAGAALRRWSGALGEVRARRRTWGADKLLVAVERAHPRARLPSRSGVTRWLARQGLAVVRPAQARRGPVLAAAEGLPVTAANDLWTVDFKGSFLTGDGQRCQPLTVRDLFSRFILCVETVSTYSEQAVGGPMRRLFKRYGLPRGIRVDNGTPFGSPTSGSALGLTSLSVEWLRLGIAVEFTRPGCPQDNGAHEQMHRVLKAETAKPAARSLAEQSRRMEAWRRDYNEQRPHAALGQRFPCEVYTPQRQAYARPKPLAYAKGWVVRVVCAKGTVRWAGLARHIGRAFAGQRVGLRQIADHTATTQRARVLEVYLGSHFLGELHTADRGGMRAAQRAQREGPRAACQAVKAKAAARASTVKPAAQ